MLIPLNAMDFQSPELPVPVRNCVLDQPEGIVLYDRADPLEFVICGVDIDFKGPLPDYVMRSYKTLLDV